MKIVGAWMLAVCISLCFAIVTSCTDDPNPGLDGSRVTAQFTPVINGEKSGTRVSGNDWQVSDRVGIYMLAYNKDELPGYEANRQYYASASGEKTTLLPAAPDQTIYYPVDGSKVKFVAYYPYDASIDLTDDDPILPVSVSDQPGENVNLLACVSPGDYCIEEPNAKLVFERQMCKIVVDITREAGVTDDLSAMTALLSGMPTTGDFKIADQTFDNLDNFDDIIPYAIKTTAVSVAFEAVIIPQVASLQLENRLMELTLGSETYIHPISKSAPFENGKIYTYYLTFTGTTLIWTNTEVTEWTGEKYSWVGDQWMSVSVAEVDLNSEASSDHLIVLYTNNSDEDDLAIYTSKSATSYDPDSQPAVDWIKITSFLPKANDQGTYLIKFSVSKYEEEDGSGGSDPGSGSDPGGGIGVGDWEEGSTIGRSAAIGNPDQNDIAIIDDYATYFRYTFGEQSVTRADDDTSRTVYLHITNGVVTIVVKVRQVDVSMDGVYKQPEANCYMVHPDGLGIAIPLANRGGIALGTSYTYEVIWSDDTRSVPVSTTSSIRYIGAQRMGNDYYLILFPGSSEGNAVVAVKVNDEVKWSWHIWTTAYNPYSHLQATLPTTNVVAMDHNLGAIKAPGYTTIQPGKEQTHGLLYQWGRKDPFPKATAATMVVEAGPVSVDETILNPFTFYTSTGDWSSSPSNELWNGATGEKTIYDPCPVDWRVPASSPWTGLTNANFAWSTNGRSNSTAGWYPAAGYRDASGALTSESTQGYYWTGGANGTSAYRMYIDAINGVNGVKTSDSGVRALGHSIRCVRE